MNIGFITIHVKNLKESVDFYSQCLGFKEVNRMEAQAGLTLVFMKDKKDNILELIFNENQGDYVEGSANVSIGITVDCMNEAIASIESFGLSIKNGPINTPNGMVIAFFNDPNGVEIEFVEGFSM